MYKEIKNKRLKNLAEIDRKIRLCACNDHIRVEGCKNCEEIKALGEKLSGLKVNSGNKRIVFEIEQRKERIKTPFHLEVHEYKKLKERGKSDLEIARMFGGNVAQIRYWKDKHKLTNANRKTPVQINESFVMTFEEYNGYRNKGLPDKKIAEIKGVHPQYIQRWKNRNDIETGPIHAKSIDLTIEQYIKFKEEGQTDLQICERYSVSKDFLYRWKRDKGLVKQKQGVN